MKGQQKVADIEEGTVRVQEGAVATGEDPTSVAIASIQSAATFPDPSVKYVFRTENGGTQVMYRVIQVAEGQLDGQTEGTSAISGFPATQSMTQAVIQGAFTSDDAGETDASGTETHYTYFPTTTVGDPSTSVGAGGTATTVVTTQNSETLLGQAASTGAGQFFVMMSPQDVCKEDQHAQLLPGPTHTLRSLMAPVLHVTRRDEPNTTKSKGGILSKACDYIQELRQSNHRLSEDLQTLDQLQMDNELLRQQVEDLKNKNLILRAQLRHHGVEIIIKNDTR